MTSPLTGDEPFHDRGRRLGLAVRDFWRWSASDLASNTLRGLVAEFLVNRAIGGPKALRTEWDAFDLVTASGAGIEVKCSAYVQAWAQRRLSTPSFDVAAKRSWYAATNTVADRPIRPARCYVFALHHHQERDTLDPCDVSQWSFYVAATAELDRHFPTTKRLGLRAIERLCGPAVTFQELAAAVADATGSAG